MPLVDEHTVFIASPGDTVADRAQIRPLIDEINSSFAPDGHRLRVVHWESDAHPDAGRPQAAINQQLDDYEIFVAVLWTRLGTPTGGFGSGTEEEISRALDRRLRGESRGAFVYFCQRPFWPASLEDVDQVRRLFEFRTRLEGEQRALPWKYTSQVELRDQLRSHLCKCLRELAKPSSRPLRGAEPDPQSIRALRELRPRLDELAQSAFSVAYNDNRASGDPGVATEHLLAALQRQARGGDSSTSALLRQIASQALPMPTEGAVVDNPYVVEEQPWLSHCVEGSINRLLKSAPTDRKLTGADIFADIAKHGTGGSVARLREHGIGPAEIDAAVRRANVDVVHT